jgi:glycogen debranching enzyme
MKTVGYLIDEIRLLSREETAAWEWLNGKGEIESIKISIQELVRSPELMARFDMLWLHDDSSKSLPRAFSDDQFRLMMHGYVRKGGSLFLSLLGAQAVVPLGFESNPPNVIRKGAWNERCWAEGYPDIRGFSGFLGHPIFKGLRGAVYTWNPTRVTPFSGAFYESPQSPSEGRVVAVERQYIRLNDDRRLVWEYQLGKGVVLAVGSLLFFENPEDRFRSHLEILAANCLEALLDRPKERKTYWEFGERSVEEFHQSSAPAPTASVSFPSVSSNLELVREPSEVRDTVFDVGGCRMIVMGKEQTGIQEMWSPPFRALKDLVIGIRTGPGELRWLRETTPKITVKPESVTRAYDVGEVRIEETTVSSHEDPCALVHLSINATHSFELVMACSVDLRMMWPYPEHATGSLRHAWDEGLKAFVVENGKDRFCTLIGSSKSPDEILAGRFSAVTLSGEKLSGVPSDRIEVGLGMRFTISEQAAAIGFYVAASDQGALEATKAYRRLSKRPGAVLNSQVHHIKRLLSHSTVLTSPDARFNNGYRWALAALDRFLMHTPSLGTSLVAGFGTTDRGWDGGHAVSGRPGYAWYFGRDAVWSAFALLQAGQFESVKAVLEFLGNHQDVTGKILHELTTSGHAHYDAADSTPLYCILLGRYLRATGDTAFVRSEFPRLVRAIEFCRPTDTDGDLLIENTNVGHGWVEGGKLYPVHTEIYLAACWAEALMQASQAAEVVGNNTVAGRWKKEGNRVRSRISKEFWNQRTGFYNFAKNSDGSYNEEKTILPAVAAYFNCVEAALMGPSMNEYASADFSADWGLRIIGQSNPMFNPSGYHYGSVWPLFTGWVSLAEFALRRPYQGLCHLVSNLQLFESFAAGYAEEVLHGEFFEPAGVCSHQAWSESMIVQPVLEGLAGIAADARALRLNIRPYLPATWDFLRIDNIAVGETSVHLELQRLQGRIAFALRASTESPLAVHLQILLPLGSMVRSTTVAGRTTTLNLSVRSFADCPEIAFNVRGAVKGSIELVEGVALEPVPVHPRAGSASVSVRCLEERMVGDVYELLLEGRSDQDYEVVVQDPAQRIVSVRGAKAWTRTGERVTITLERVGDRSATGYHRSHLGFELAQGAHTR